MGKLVFDLVNGKIKKGDFLFIFRKTKQDIPPWAQAYNICFASPK